MSKDAIKFVEKMKRENPQAFEFLGRASMNILSQLREDLKKDLIEWQQRAIKIDGTQKTIELLRDLIDKMESEKE